MIMTREVCNTHCVLELCSKWKWSASCSIHCDSNERAAGSN